LDLENLIEIAPVEFDLNRGPRISPRIRKYYEIKFADTISPEIIKGVTKKIKTRKKIKVDLITVIFFGAIKVQNPLSYLIY
jgi:hypothetical protein